MNKLIYFIVLLSYCVITSCKVSAINVSTLPLDIKDAGFPVEGNVNEEHENTNAKKIIFRAKINSLWFKDSISAADKKNKDIIEISLEGEMYDKPQKIVDVSKGKSNNSTPFLLVSSYFSANKKGDLNWIVDNFTNEEQSNVRDLFKNKKLLQDSQKDLQSIKAKYLKGEVHYKDYTILLIEQRYKNGKNVTEAIACKQTSEGWKLTNDLGNDKTFDIVFAAVANGEVIKE